MISPRPGDFIRHKSAMDVCLEVKACFDYGHGYSVKGIWWNMAFVRSFPIGQFVSTRINFKKDRAEISASKKVWIGDWEVLKDRIPPECLRDGTWISLKGLDSSDSAALPAGCSSPAEEELASSSPDIQLASPDSPAPR